MKRMKKLSVVFMALVMMLTMAFTAVAAGSGSITVNGTTVGKTYDLYRVFDMTRNEDGTNVAYTINSDWEDFFNGSGSKYIVSENDTAANGNKGLSAITVDGTVKYINIFSNDTTGKNGNIAAFAKDALIYAAGKDATASKDAEGTSVTFTGLDLGYYLVYPQSATDIDDAYASICSLTSTNTEATVAVKATYPTIEKTDDKESADVGGTVTYTITGKVPDTTGFTTYTYKISDTMSDGLTFDGTGTIDVKVGGEDTTEFTAKATDKGFELTINVMNLQDNVGAEIEVTYTATVNANAVSQIENNKATLEYSNNPQTNTTTTTTPDEEKVHSAKIDIVKVDGAKEEVKLAGAEFVLKNSDKTKYYATASNATETDANDWKVVWVENKDDAAVVTTDENGAACFPGLADGTYYLEEIKAPAGYNLLTEDTTVEIAGNDDNTTTLTTSVTVKNNSGTLLPSTGGMGTTMFYVFGGVLVLAAMVLFVVKIRMKNEN